MTKEIYHVTEIEHGERLDKVLVTHIQDVSRQHIQALIKNELVTVNDKSKKPNYKCKTNDVITWTIPEPAEREPIKPEAIPLQIVYEDDFLIVINKPKGLLIHPTDKARTGTLVNGLLHYSNRLSDLGGLERNGIVHRLDQETSGLVVIAKDNETHAHLKEQFKKRTVKRIYEAIVIGNVSQTEGIIQAPIGRHPKQRLHMTVIASGKEAETHFRILESFSKATLVQCELKTGRTHQIRVHMKYIGHPIIGDPLYNRQKRFKSINGQMLFAKKLCFNHPVSEERLCFECERPEEFKNLLHKL